MNESPSAAARPGADQIAKNTPITLQNKYFTNLIYTFSFCYDIGEPRKYYFLGVFFEKLTE